jgi:hypothetical protein
MNERERLTAEGIDYVYQLVREAGLRIEVGRHRDGKRARLSVHCPKLFRAGAHEIVGLYLLPKDRAKAVLAYCEKKRAGRMSTEVGKQLEEYVRSYVSPLVGDVMYQMTTAGNSRSTFLSGSRLETAFLASLERAG